MVLKKHNKQLPAGIYKILLVVAALVWGLGFVVMKDALTVVPTAQLLGLRFVLTGLILFALFFKSIRASFNKEHLIYGGLLGVAMFAAFWLQASGLTESMPGKNAFLTATYVVFVPFICWLVIRKRPSVYHVVAAFICVVGIGLVSLQASLAMEFADFITIIGSVLFALHIVLVARWSKGRDILVLTVYQFIAAGICGLVVGSFIETWPPLSVLLAPEFLLDLGYLVVFASCVALVIQNVSLAHVPATQVSLFLSLEAVFGVAFSALMYGEALTTKLLFGFGLIFVAIIVSETFPLKKPVFSRFRKPKAQTVVKSEVPVQDVALRSEGGYRKDTSPATPAVEPLYTLSSAERSNYPLK